MNKNYFIALALVFALQIWQSSCYADYDGYDDPKGTTTDSDWTTGGW